MCGVTGWLYTQGRVPAAEALGRMAQAIRHRGPDDEGFFREPAAGLAVAHRRLSIIYLSSASHQPPATSLTKTQLLAWFWPIAMICTTSKHRALNSINQIPKANNDDHSKILYLHRKCCAIPSEIQGKRWCLPKTIQYLRARIKPYYC
jgi:hypothetical protein